MSSLAGKRMGAATAFFRGAHGRVVLPGHGLPGRDSAGRRPAAHCGKAGRVAVGQVPCGVASWP